jgi:hypothetical protein
MRDLEEGRPLPVLRIFGGWTGGSVSSEDRPAFFFGFLGFLNHKAMLVNVFSLLFVGFTFSSLVLSCRTNPRDGAYGYKKKKPIEPNISAYWVGKGAFILPEEKLYPSVS